MKTLLILFVLALLFALASVASALPVTIGWTDPNPPEKNVILYRLYKADSERNGVSLYQGAETQATVDLKAGDEIWITAIDSGFKESEPSERLIVVERGRTDAPSGPTQMRIIGSVKFDLIIKTEPTTP